jgi:hypothetical protein
MECDVDIENYLPQELDKGLYGFNYTGQVAIK